MSDQNLRAFPSAAIDDRFGGMSLRDWFAGQALPGLIDQIDGTGGTKEVAILCAKAAFIFADAMIVESQGGDRG